ncbi:MAG TPA: sodium:solute symporter [Lacipirellulaceae bacterium]
MTSVDWIVVAAYFGLILGLAWWVILQRKDTAADYFLAGRHLGWFIIGASIFASNIGSEHLVGLAGTGATNGVIFAHYELHAWCLLVLGWVLVPFYIRSKVFTMPEFLERRFSPSARWLLSVISLVAYVITKIAVGIFAGGVVFSTLLPDWGFTAGGWNIDSFWIGSIAVVVLTGLYTVLGGMRAVAYTEALQTIILVAGSALVTWFGLKALGGWNELRQSLGSDAFNLWDPLLPEGVRGVWSPVEVRDASGSVVEQAWYFTHEGNYPWVGMLFCAPIIGLWYWCTDQYIVQRALGAPNEQQARRGSIFASFLKLLPVFIFIIPGMICVALAKTGDYAALSGMIDRNGNVVNEEAQRAFPLLISAVLPEGARGMVVAGLLAALMSSLAGVFNASSTLFTMDFYSKLHPTASQAQLVWIGRAATTAMVLIGLIWIPVIQGAEGLYSYLQGVQAYLGPPIFVVFFLGVFWKRLNGPGCMAALIVGFLMGLLRLAVDTPVSLKMEGFENGWTEGSFAWIVNRVYFQYYSLLIFLVSIASMVIVSYATPAPSEDRLKGLTFGTLTREHRQESRASWSAVDVIASTVVMAAIIAAYVYFRG